MQVEDVIRLQEHLRELYQQLSVPIEAEPRTSNTEGYIATGYRYQYIVNRLNEVMGVGGWRAINVRFVDLPKRKTKGKWDDNNRRYIPGTEKEMHVVMCDLILQLGYFVNDEFMVMAEALGMGDHDALQYPNARKGAHTAAIKKAAAFFGVGKEVYEGLDDDDGSGNNSSSTKGSGDRDAFMKELEKMAGEYWPQNTQIKLNDFCKSKYNKSEPKWLKTDELREMVAGFKEVMAKKKTEQDKQGQSAPQHEGISEETARIVRQHLDRLFGADIFGRKEGEDYMREVIGKPVDALTEEEGGQVIKELESKSRSAYSR
jgi:hypothetical protein